MKFEREIPTEGRYGLVVCGGGFSGFAAAFSAAREGVRTLLVEQGFCLGGVGTSGLVNHILGVRFREGNKIRTCVKGLFSELEEELIREGNGVDYRSVSPDFNPHGWKPSLGVGLVFDNEAMKLLLEKKLEEAGVTVLYGTRLVDVVGGPEKAEAVLLHNKNGLFFVEADLFIDATGDGDLCAQAGLPFDFGDEEGGLSAASLEMHVENVDSDALGAYMRETADLRFTKIISKLKEKELWPFPYEIFISVLLTEPGVYMINTIRQVGINGTDASSLTQGVFEGRKENYELLSVMRAHFPGFQNARVRQIAPTIGIRETRRIRTVATLKVSHLVEAASFEDSIALSGYSWDMPNPKKPSFQPYHGVKRKSRVTEIPYRALLPQGAENVLVVGRCIGAEREALGAVRVMGPCIAMGEAAGIAAHLALKDGVGFPHVSVSELKRIIEARGGLTSRNQVSE
ncbi:MAG: FAD-dependent oxidoreductase [Clostridia bacterium]|nr:FAD-dependent oxidoreductase [Clostridia bacterium]